MSDSEIIIIDQDFSPICYQEQFEKGCGDAGAIASFLGRVRAEDGVKSLELQSYPPVTEQGIEQAIKEAKSRWELINVQIIHRIGVIKPGQAIVLVMCASKHRRDSFQACDYLMDYLKTEAIFWKKQNYTDEHKLKSEWIEPRSQDYIDKNRW